MGLSVFPLFGHIQHVADFTLSGDGFDTEYPVSNLANTEFARAARAVGMLESPVQDVVIRGTITGSDPVTVQAVTLAAHTLPLAATGRLELFSDTAWTTREYDSGVGRIHPEVYTYGGRSWWTPMFWTGQNSPAELAGQVANQFWITDTPYVIRSFRITLTAATSFDIGALFVDEAWQPTSGMEVGAPFGYEHFSVEDTLPGGLRRFDPYTPGFTVSGGQIPYLPNDEAQQFALSMLRRFSIHTPFLFVMHPTRPRTWLDMAKIVTFTPQPGLLSAALPDRDHFPVNLIEYKG